MTIICKQSQFKVTILDINKLYKIKWFQGNILIYLSIYLLFYSSESFLHQHQLMVFHWSLSDSKYPQVSETLLSILANLSSAVIWMVSTRVLISNSSSPFTNPLVTILSILITVGITITFIFHSFFSSLARFRYLSLFLPSFIFTLGSAGMAKSTIQQVLCFLLTIAKSGCLGEIRWSIFILKSFRILCISFSRMDSRLCIYHLFAWSNLNFLHSSQLITFFS